MVALGAGEGEPRHFERARVALVKIKCDDLGIAVDTQCQLGQIVGANRKAVKQPREGVDLDDVVWDLAHHIGLELVFALFQPVPRHCLYYRLALGNTCSLIMNSMRASPTPSLGSIAT